MKKRINFRTYFGRSSAVTLVLRDKSRRVLSPMFGEPTTSWLRRIGARETIHPAKRFAVVQIPPGVAEVFVTGNRDGELVVRDESTGAVPADVYRTFWVLAQDVADLVKAFKA